MSTDTAPSWFTYLEHKTTKGRAIEPREHLQIPDKELIEWIRSWLPKNHAFNQRTKRRGV